jgi:hypothetical protein
MAHSHKISGLRKKVLVLGDVILRCEMHASMLRCLQVRITALGNRIRQQQQQQQ